MPQRSDLRDETVVVLVCTGRTGDGANWASLLDSDGESDAQQAGRALYEVFRQLGLSGQEPEIAWLVSGLGCAQQTAAIALREAGLEPDERVMAVDCRFNPPAPQTLSSKGGGARGWLHQWAGSVHAMLLRHQRRAEPVAGGDHTVRMTVAFGHAEVWPEIIEKMTTGRTGRHRIARALDGATVVLLRSRHGGLPFDAQVVTAP